MACLRQLAEDAPDFTLGPDLLCIVITGGMGSQSRPFMVLRKDKTLRRAIAECWALWMMWQETKQGARAQAEHDGRARG